MEVRRSWAQRLTQAFRAAPAFNDQKSWAELMALPTCVPRSQIGRWAGLNRGRDQVVVPCVARGPAGRPVATMGVNVCTKRLADSHRAPPFPTPEILLEMQGELRHQHRTVAMALGFEDELARQLTALMNPLAQGKAP